MKSRAPCAPDSLANRVSSLQNERGTIRREKAATLERIIGAQNIA